jgi:8-oxo-dGTP pyrophosphatase MutT (NUDIX family)
VLLRQITKAMFEEFITHLKIKLQEPLPGEDAQFEMAPVGRKRMSQQSIDYNEHNETILLLIERVTYDGHHSGQIALPGGKADDTDNGLEATALREFFEETGADATPIVIGKLTPVYIPVSKFMVQPFVAYLPKRPHFTINRYEVAHLIEWPFTNFISAETVKQTTVEPTPGLILSTPYFDVQDKILWGATAMIMNELKWVLKK